MIPLPGPMREGEERYTESLACSMPRSGAGALDSEAKEDPPRNEMLLSESRTSHLKTTGSNTENGDGYRSSAERSLDQRLSDGNHSPTAVPACARKANYAAGAEGSNQELDILEDDNTLAIFPSGEVAPGPDSGSGVCAVDSNSSSTARDDQAQVECRDGVLKISDSVLYSPNSDSDLDNTSRKDPVWHWLEDMHMGKVATEKEPNREEQSPVSPTVDRFAAQSADNHPLPRDGSLSRSLCNEVATKQRPRNDLNKDTRDSKVTSSSAISKARNGGLTGKTHPLSARQRRRRTSISWSTGKATGLFSSSGMDLSLAALNSCAGAGGVGEQTSIGGHHLAFRCNGIFMKESCSRREERFYERLKPVQEYVLRYVNYFARLYASEEDEDTEFGSNNVTEGEDVRQPCTTAPASSIAHKEDVSASCPKVSCDHCKAGGMCAMLWRCLPLTHQRVSTKSVDAGACGTCDTKDIKTDDVCRENECPLFHGVQMDEEEVPLAAGRRDWEFLVRLAPFVPRYHGLFVVQLNRADGGTPTPKRILRCATSPLVTDTSSGDERPPYQGGSPLADDASSRQMIVLEDICSGFKHPCVLDMKMGRRQYGLNPSEAKRRSKEHKAACTTTKQYGVRLAGMRRWCPDKQQYETRSKLAGRLLSLEELQDTVFRFMQRSQSIRQGFRRLIKRLRRAFVQRHIYRFFTSSLLFVYDADEPLESSRVVMVDFAFTYDRDELQLGGDPDAGQDEDLGYINALETVLQMLS